jgi:hypothetical protein
MRPTSQILNLKELNPTPPCLTLILSTHKSFPDNLQDPMRFKRLLRVAEGELQSYSEVASDDFLRPLRALTVDTDFWAHTETGVMILRSAEVFHVQALNQAWEDSVFVGSHFRQPTVKHPGEPHFILSLHGNGAQIYLADANHIRKMETPKQITEGHALLLSQFPRHGMNKELAHVHLEQFFRLVDEIVTETFSRPASFPVLLVCLPEHQALYRKISKNPHLLPEGISQHPASLPMHALHQKTQGVIELQEMQRLSKLIESFYRSEAQGATSTDLKKIKHAALEGRIATLLMSEGTQEPALKALAEKVTEMGGEAIAVPAGMLPDPQSAAAIYRY